MVPGGAKFRETIELGVTQMTQPQVDELLRRLSRDYLGDRYHLLYRNVRAHRAERLEAARARRLTALARSPVQPLLRGAGAGADGAGAAVLGEPPGGRGAHRCVLFAAALPCSSDPGCARSPVNTFTPCILPASVRALAKVPSMPALATTLADTMPLLGETPTGTRATDKGLPGLMVPRQTRMER